MKKLIKNINTKIGYSFIVLAMVITSILGVFIVDNLDASGTSITVPGGTASDNSVYDDYTYGTDAPTSGEYGQDTTKFKRVLNNPSGVAISAGYYSTETGSIAANRLTTGSNTPVVDTGDGYLVNVYAFYRDAAGLTQGAQHTIRKYDYNLNLVQSNVAYNSRRWLEYSYMNEPKGKTVYKALTNNLETATIRASDGIVTAMGAQLYPTAPAGYTASGPTKLTNSGWGGLRLYTNSPATINKGAVLKINSATGTIAETKILNNPYGNQISTANLMYTSVHELDNGNFVVRWQEDDYHTGSTVKYYMGLSLYDSNFNLIKGNMTGTPVAKQSFLYLTTTTDGNIVFQVSHPTNGNRIVEYDKTTGAEVKSKSFAVENASFSNVVSLSTVQDGVSYYFIGTASGTGQFSGYTTDSGVVLAGLDEDFNVLSANFLLASAYYRFYGISERFDGKIVVNGMTSPGGARELFNQRVDGGVTNPLGEGFLGTFDQALDYAPKLKIPNNVNVVLNGTESASEIDAKMLQYISNDMNGETNKYDDYTSNAELLQRINKNINSKDYASDTIDWSLFGLTPKTHTGTGKATYEVGPQTVTYGVIDEQLNETVVSGRVNICTPETVTDLGTCDTANSEIALHAENFRVAKGQVSGINYTTKSNLKAWVLGTGVEETNTNVTWVNSAVQDKVGVYPVTYTYASNGKTATKTVYVSVYDTDTVSGPEDTNTDPDNLLNTELLHAKSVTLRIGEATGKTLDEITGVQAWNANTGSSVTFGSVVDKPYTSSAPTADMYTIEYTTTRGTTKTVTVTITTGTVPTLAVTPAVISVDKDATLTATQAIMHGVVGNDAEDGPLTATYTGTVDTSIVGTHYIEYRAIDSDNNVATGLRAYTVGAKVVGANYAIYANNFTKNVSQVNTAHSAILNDSGAYADKITSVGTGTVQVDSIGGYTNVPGGYVIGLSVTEEPATNTTIIANVIENGVVGSKYAIEADNITMYISEVAGRTPLQIFKNAGMKAWDVTTGADQTNGVSTPTITPTFNGAAAGTYSVTLSVGSGANTQPLTKTITLLAGGMPSLSVTPKQVLLDLNATSPTLLDGVSASDVEDGNITHKVVPTGSVNTAIQGVYHVTYTIKDNDNNEVSEKRTYIVGNNPVVGTEYVLFAEPFTKHIDDVDTLDTAIILDANAKAYSLTDGTDAAITITNKGGYSAAVGPYKINFAVTNEQNTKKEVVASVYQHGNPALDEIVELKDVTLRKSEATGKSLRVITEAKAWNKTTGATVGVTMSSTPVYNQANPSVDTYATTATTTSSYATTNTATVNITTGNKPVLTVTQPVVELPTGATLNPTVLQGVSVTDIEDDAAGYTINIVTNKVDSNIDVNTPNVYIVEYTATDRDGNVADTKTRTYVVGAKTLTGTYAVFGNDFSIRKGQVNTVTPNDQIKTNGNLRAVLLSDGTTPGTIDVSNNGGYTNTVGTYPVNFEVLEDTTSTGNILATVTTGNLPVLAVNPARVEVAIGATVSGTEIKTGVSATDIEDGNITSTITYTGSVNTAIAGTYIINYSVVDTDGNEATGTRSYLVGAIGVGTNYAIYGHDFNLRIAEVTTSAKEAQIRTLSEIKAEKISDGSAAAVTMISDDDYTNVAATYQPSFRVTLEAGTTAQITATVGAGNVPVITVTPSMVQLNVGDTIPTDAVIKTGVDVQDIEDGDISHKVTYTGTVNTSVQGVNIINYSVVDADGNIATGTRSYVVGASSIGTEYAIFGNDFTIRTGQVDTSNTETQIRTKSGIKAEKISDGTPGTLTMLSDDNYTNVASIYQPTFRVDQETGTTHAITATVTDGQAPVLTVNPARVQLTKGAAAPVILQGVTAQDTEDGNITSGITVTSGVVNTAVPGTYVITYSVTDTDGNTVTGTRSYLVAPLVVGTDYAIYGHDFSIRIGDVDTSDTEGQIRTLSNVKAEKISDGTSATLTMTTDGSYTNVAGIYTATFEVDAEPGTKGNIVATVATGDAPVLTVNPAVIRLNKGDAVPSDTDIKTGVSATDTEDGNITSNMTYTGSVDTSVEGVYVINYSVIDNDGNEATGTRSYIVGGVVGTHYAIFGDDFTIRKGLVDESNKEAQLRTQTNIRAQKISDGSTATITMRGDGGYQATVGNYQPTFEVDDETSTKLQPTAHVVAGNIPTMTVNPTRIELAVGATTPSDTAIRTGVSSTDVEDGNITGNITYTGSIVTTTPGTYVITYSVTDTDDNTVTGTRSYLVGAIKVGTDYAIYGNDFSLRTGEVDTSNTATQIRTKSNIKAEKIVDGSPATITMTSDNGYTNTVGIYHPDFKVDAEPGTTQTIAATVTAGTAPTLTVIPTQIILQTGDATPTDTAIKTGVTANDLEDGNITNNITYIGTINTASPGTYVIDYSVTDTDGNTTTGKRSYLVSPLKVGDNYAIYGNDFTIRKGQVDTSNKETQLRNLSNIKAEKLSDGSSVPVTMNTDGSYTNSAGTYQAIFRVNAEPGTTGDINATVTNGDAPVITVNPKRVELNLNDTTPNNTQIRNGVTATDTEDGTITASMTNSGTIDTTTPGTYVITYSVTDTDGNTTTATRSYLVAPLFVGTDYAIYGNDFSLRSGQVTNGNKETQIRNLSNIKAEKIVDGTSATITMNTADGYSRTVNTYHPEFIVDDEPTTRTTITADVLAGDAPVLTITPTQTELALNATALTPADMKTGVTATDTEDGNITSSITTSGTVNTAVAGTYIVTYTVTDSDGNLATGTRSYLVGAIKVGTDYAIYGNNFTVLVSDVDMADRQGQIEAKSHIKAEKIVDGSAATIEMVHDGGYTNTPGSYQPLFRVGEEPDTRETITVTVATGTAPVLTVNPAVIQINKNDPTPTDAEIKTGVLALDNEDGNITSQVTYTANINTAQEGVYIVTYTVKDNDNNEVSNTRSYVVGGTLGTDYAIFKDDFTIRKGQVDTSNKETQIRTLSQVRAQKVSDGSNATITMATDGSYTDTVGVYYPGFTVDAETSTSTTITADVIAGNEPTITVNPAYISMNIADAQPTLLAKKTGVSATDIEDGDITASITVTGTIDPTTQGTYIITYTVTDSDGNTTTGTRSYLVGALSIGTDYVIYGNDFSIRKGQVDILNQLNKETQLATLSNIRAEKIADKTPANIILNTDDGYTNTVGTYTPEYAVLEELITTTNITATVVTGNSPTLTILPSIESISLHATTPSDTAIRTGVSSTDVEDGNITGNITYTGSIDTTTAGTYIITYSITDSDNNTTTGIRSYLVGAIAIGTEYAIYGDNFTLRQGEVDTTNKEGQIRSASNIKAEKITDGTPTPITMTSDDNYTNVAGTYVPSFQVDAEPATVGNITATIITGDKPVIVDTTPVVSVPLGTSINTSDDVTAIDTEDGIITASITISGDTVDTTIKGVYHVTYNVTDTDSNQADEVTRIYVVGGQVGTDYAIFAEYFTKRVGEVDTLDTAIITHAEAYAMKLSDKTTTAIQVTNTNGYTATPATYPITFTVTAEATTEITINATVITGAKPVILDTTPVVSVALGATVNTQAAVTAQDTEDGNLTTSIVISGDSVDTTTKGVYHVTYNVTDSDGNLADEVTRIYVVDGTVGTDYAIFAEDFTKRVGLVDTLDTTITTDATAYAIKLSDKTPAAVHITNTSGYTNTPATYPITFVVAAETTTGITIDATVITGDKPIILDTTPVVELELGESVNTLAHVTAQDTEDGNLTASIIVGGDIVDTTTRGVYHVTYNVTDSDTNQADTVTRVYVVDGVAGTDYAIFASNFTKRVGEVNTQDAAIILEATAHAIKLSDKSQATVHITNKNGYAATVGTYPIAFAVDLETSTTTTINASVIIGDKPIITDSTPIVGVNLGDTINTAADVTAGDTEDGNITPYITIGGDTVDTTTKGVYHVTYNVTDSDSNQADEVTRIYVVGGNYGTHYAIFATDFTKYTTEVDTTHEAIITHAEAYAIKLSDKTPVDVEVANTNGYCTTEGAYPIEFAITNEVTTTTTINATVKDFKVTVDGNDFIVYASELEEQINNDNLEAFILEKSEATATLEADGQTASVNVVVDAGNLKNGVEVKDYTVDLGVETNEVTTHLNQISSSNETRTVATNTEENNVEIYTSKAINITVLADAKDNNNNKGDLVSTGQNITETMFIGVIMMLIALISLVITRKSRKTTNE